MDPKPENQTNTSRFSDYPSDSMDIVQKFQKNTTELILNGFIMGLCFGVLFEFIIESWSYPSLWELLMAGKFDLKFIWKLAAELIFGGHLLRVGKKLKS